MYITKRTSRLLKSIIDQLIFPAILQDFKDLQEIKVEPQNQSHPQQREQFNNINMYVCIMSHMGFRVNPHYIVV